MSAHLVTIGTSVLRNAMFRIGRDACSSQLSEDEVKSCAECLKLCADPRSIDEDRCSQCLTKGSRCWKTVECMLSSDPAGMSAELNAMKWVLESNCEGVKKIILYHSDTVPGSKAAQLLASYLEATCREAIVEMRNIEGLSKEMWLGIANLGATIIRDVIALRNQGLDTYINLTGGFKPESGIALLAAAASGAQAAYYIHESFREVVWLPLPALAIDRERLKKLTELIETITQSEEIDPQDPKLAEFKWLINILKQMNYLKPEKERNTLKATPALKRNLKYLAEYIKKLALLT